VTLQRIPTDVKRVLALSAHPDDAEFFAGAALAQLCREGAEVTLVVCTDGQRGGRDLEAAATLRSQEQAASARILGLKEVVELGFEDGRLEPGDALRRRLVEQIRRTRAELVLGHDPRTFWQQVGGRAHPGHSDHRAAGTALLDAVYPRAASPNFEPGCGGPPWYPRQLWLFDCSEPDFLVDATAGFDTKLEALRAHASQEAVAGGLVQAARELGARFGSPEQPAEAFVRLVLW